MENSRRLNEERAGSARDKAKVEVAAFLFASCDKGRRPMLLQLAVGVIVAYGGIVGVMYLAQRSLMYVPDLSRLSPVAAGRPQAEEITLTTADGERSRPRLARRRRPAAGRGGNAHDGR